jgi:DNA-binding response OmpR family regulator
MPSPAKRRVLVVEDEKKTAEVLRLYLEHGGYEVTVASTGEAALAQARTGRHDLVLLDRMLPGLDGVAICRALRAESDVAIILVTARTAEEDRLEGLGAGADDYVSKPFSPREVLARVRAVLRRSKSERTSQPVIRSRTVELHLGERVATVRGRLVALSRAEFDLLAAFVRAPGRTFSREELVERVFGDEKDVLARTVDAGVMRLRRKIEEKGCPPLLVTVFGVGYRLDDSRDA